MDNFSTNQIQLLSKGDLILSNNKEILRDSTEGEVQSEFNINDFGEANTIINFHYFEAENILALSVSDNENRANEILIIRDFKVIKTYSCNNYFSYSEIDDKIYFSKDNLCNGYFCYDIQNERLYYNENELPQFENFGDILFLEDNSYIYGGTKSAFWGFVITDVLYQTVTGVMHKDQRGNINQVSPLMLNTSLTLSQPFIQINATDAKKIIEINSSFER